jgi:autotransporter-associated beta strand protein
MPGAGLLTAGGADNTPGELILNNATTVTVNSVIADNGSGAVAFTKSGVGVLNLAGACSNSGGFAVNAGTVFLTAGTDRLGTNGPVTVTGGTLNLGGSSNNTAGAVTFLGGLVTNGTIVKTGAAYDAQAGTVAARLGGPVGLIKTSAGTLSLGSANSYTGDTVVLEGSLSATAAGATKGAIIIGSVTGGPPATFTGGGVDAVADTATVTVYSNGTFNLGNGDNLNNLTLLGGTFTPGNGYINGTINLTGGRMIIGSIVAGTVYGNHSTYNVYAADVTSLIACNNNMGLYNNTFTVADGSPVIDLKVTANWSGNNSANTITKAGPGVMQFAPPAGGNSWNFHTFYVNGGTLLLDNPSGSGSGKSRLSVGAGGTLGGVGFIGGGDSNYTNANVFLSGTNGNYAVLAPGTINAANNEHLIGTLSVGSAAQTNNVSLGNYSRLALTFAADGSHDQLAINGTLNLKLANGANATNNLTLTGADSLKGGSYLLVGATNGIVGQFKTTNGLPERSTIVYNATDIQLVVNKPAGALIVIR